MLYNSSLFLAFLLPSIVIFKRLSNYLKATFLLVLSLFFYASIDHRFIYTILSLTFFNYLLARFVVKTNFIFYFCVICNISTLFLFKFSSSLIYPIGMSYYIFQSLGYIFDVRSKQIEPEKSFSALLLYNLFFPRILAGPIEKYQHFNSQVNKLETNSSNITSGFNILLYGIIKKAIVSDRILKIYDYSILEKNKYELGVTLLLFLTSSFAVYIDFSAYSDMAFGLAKMFGIKITHNFNSPYSSNKFSTLWKRWHVSLYLWIKEYLFDPMKKLNLPGLKSRSLLIIFCFLLSGIWHSNFGGLLWGLSCGIFVVLDRKLERYYEYLHHVFRKMIVFILISFASFVYFIKDYNQLTKIIDHFNFLFSKKLFNSFISLNSLQSFDIALIIFLIPVIVFIDHKFSQDRNLPSRFNLAQQIALMTFFLFLWYAFGFSSTKPFIYSRV
jgi:alginate O-acetyltransferase complex protein AlgI